MTSVVGSLPELLGFTPAKLFLQVELSPTYVNAAGHDIATFTGGVATFTVAEPLVVGLYVARIDDAVGTIWTGFAAYLDGAWRLVADRPQAVPLVGGYTLTVTVQDGAAVGLQGAAVRVAVNGTNETKQTPVGGVAAFAVVAATYTLTTICPGYSSDVRTVTVTANTAVTVTLSQVAGVTPSADPTTTTGYATLRDEQAVAEAGATVKVQLESWPAGSGHGFDTAVKEYTADGTGLVQVPGMLKGATYLITRGAKKNQQSVTVPANAGTTWAITNFGGAS